MDFQTYKQNALRTEARPAEISFGPVGLHAILGIAIMSSELMDTLKKTLFYGKPLDHDLMISQAAQIANLAIFVGEHTQARQITNPNDIETINFGGDAPEQLKNAKLSNINLRLLHGAMGIFTEAGELLTALSAQYEGRDLDKVNFAEELGDVDWYKAILHDETGTDEGAIRAINIAKLKARFPDKFTTEAALNRDLTAERKILEDASVYPGGREIGGPGIMKASV